MPWVSPEGYFNGDRIASLSDKAQLIWTLLYLSSNGYGRFPVDYRALCATAFRRLRNKPTECEVKDLLREYRDKYLLFLYTAPDGTRWAAWDSQSGQKYYSAADKKSPAPPEKEFVAWRQEYARKKAQAASNLTSFADDLFGKPEPQTPLPFHAEVFSKNGDFGKESANLGKETPFSFPTSDQNRAGISTQHNTTSLSTLTSIQLLEEGVGETKQIADLGMFEFWWNLWCSVRSNNHREFAFRAWLSYVTSDNVADLLECTRTYLAGAGADPTAGYNPENFLSDQAVDRYKTRFPPKKPNGKTSYVSDFRRLTEEDIADGRV